MPWVAPAPELSIQQGLTVPVEALVSAPGLADPGPLPSGGSDPRVLGTDLQLSFGFSAGGSLRWDPEQGIIRVPRGAPVGVEVEVEAAAEEERSVRPRLDADAEPSRYRLGGLPYPDVVAQELILHHHRILRDLVSHDVGEAEALRLFDQYDVYLQRFVDGGGRVEDTEARPASLPGGSVDQPQDRVPQGSVPLPQDRVPQGSVPLPQDRVPQGCVPQPQGGSPDSRDPAKGKAPVAE